MKKFLFLVVLLLSAGCVQQEAVPEGLETTMVAGGIVISTDKSEYVQGETVKITLENDLGRDVYFAYCEYLVLEKEVWNKWELATEKKCRNNRITHSLAPGDTKEFSLETRQSANNYLDQGIYKEVFKMYFGCSDSSPENCESNETYYSNVFEVGRRRLPELEDILNISIETDREEYGFEDTVRVTVRINSPRNVGTATLDVEGIRYGCDRIDSSQEVNIIAGESSFAYDYRIPAADDELSIEAGLYGINADILYEGEFDGISYDNEIVASAREKIEIVGV